MSGVSRVQPSSGHTPTPWVILPDENGNPTYIVGPQQDHAIAECDFGYGIEDDANAALIVEAVNSHATLKARVAELELWQRANLEVRDIDSARIAELEANERALVSALESSREHIAADADSMTPGWRSAARLVEEINAALSHAGPVARDGER
jgi:hypothetical protein